MNGPSSGKSRPVSRTVSNHGQRVVEGQRLMQASSDIFLGRRRVDLQDGEHRDFHVRQLWDWKASASFESMNPKVLEIYASICAWTLARAHSPSGSAPAIGAYLGSSDAFDHALAACARSYAKQNERDHQALLDAIASGTITAESGI